MDRKDFLKTGFLGLTGLTLLPSFTLQEDVYKKELALIADLVDFGNEHLELESIDFFSNWEEDESYHYYLYVSYGDKLESPKDFVPFKYFGLNKDEAIEQQKKLIDQGMHTLLYKRLGGGKGKLTTELLALPHESIAFFVYHEMMHNYLSNNAKQLSLALKESACDVMGHFGSKFFAERFDTLNKKKVKAQKNKYETLVETIQKNAQTLKDSPEKSASIFAKTEASVFDLFKKSDSLWQGRYIYPVNNAYFVKNLQHTDNYTLLQDLAIQSKYINTFLYKLTQLPKNKNKAIEAIKKELGSN